MTSPWALRRPGACRAAWRWLASARPLTAVALLLASLGLQEGAQAQSAAGGSGIYTCIDGKGRKITSDRPIPECLDREQAVRGSDGAVRRTVAPSMTADERAAYEEAQRKKLARDAALRDAIRQDRHLLARYPDEATHQRARDAALEPTVQALHMNTRRMDELQAQAKQLANEAEFYRGKSMPAALRAKIDSNLASIEAHKSAAETQQAELKRQTARYDEELVRLRTLWGGAPLGQRAAASQASKP